MSSTSHQRVSARQRSRGLNGVPSRRGWLGFKLSGIARQRSNQRTGGAISIVGFLAVICFSALSSSSALAAPRIWTVPTPAQPPHAWIQSLTFGIDRHEPALILGERSNASNDPRLVQLKLNIADDNRVTPVFEDVTGDSSQLARQAASAIEMNEGHWWRKQNVTANGETARLRAVNHSYEGFDRYWIERRGGLLGLYQTVVGGTFNQIGGEGAIARDIALESPSAVTVGPGGGIFVVDHADGENRVRLVSAPADELPTLETIKAALGKLQMDNVRGQLRELADTAKRPALREEQPDPNTTRKFTARLILYQVQHDKDLGASFSAFR